MGEVNGKHLVTNMFQVANVNDLNNQLVILYKLVSLKPNIKLKSIARYISNNIIKRDEVFALPYITSDTVYVAVIGSENAKSINELKGEGWGIEKYSETIVGKLGRRFITTLLNELYAQAISNYGYYRISYGRRFINASRYETIEGKIARYRLYSGFVVKIEMINDGYYVFIDPLRTMTLDRCLADLIEHEDSSKYWLETSTSKKRGMFAVYEKAEGVHILRYGKLDHIDKASTVSTYKINTPPYAREKCGDKVTLKGYYTCVLNAIEAAFIKDNEPVVFLSDGMAYPPRVLYPIIHIDDLKNEVKEVKRKFFINPEERFTLTSMGRDLLANISIFNLPELKLDKKPTEYEFQIIPTPKLLAGNSHEFTPDVSSGGAYRDSILDSLKKVGPYGGSLRKGKAYILIKPKAGVSEEMVYKLYKDIRKTAEIKFSVNLPQRTTIRKYKNLPFLEEELNKFKDDISFIISVLERKKDKDYILLKRLFNELGIPSQMITSEIVELKYKAKTNKKARKKYSGATLNLTSGILGKAGIKLWVLREPLKADLYVGLDIGHYPTKKYPSIVTLTFIDSRGAYITADVIQTGSKRKLALDDLQKGRLKTIFEGVISRLRREQYKVEKIVIHKDGDVYSDDINTLREIANIFNVKLAFISIKKSKGPRLYIREDGKVKAPATGSYVILSSNKALIINAGCEFIRQGTPAPLLLELVYNDFNYTIEDALKEVHFLSYIHWQTITGKAKIPVTISYADEYAYLALHEVKPGAIPPL